MKGKQPDNPSVEQKIMFWKAYRGYIKRELNRMRQVSVSQFRQLLFKGKNIAILIFHNEIYIYILIL